MTDDLDIGSRVATALRDVTPPPELGTLVLDRIERRRARRRTARAGVSVAAAAVLVVTGLVLNRPRDGDRRDELLTDAGSAEFRWERLPPAPVPTRGHSGAVWTGTEVLFWGGRTSSNSRHGNRADGAAYDPAKRSWRTLAEAPLGPRSAHVAVWTGTEMLVWGGWRPDGPIEDPAGWADGGAYDPATDSWRRIPDAPIGPRLGVGAAWTGSELVIVGGGQAGSPHVEAVGAAYDPARDTWRLLPDLPFDSFTGGWATWTGEEVLYVRPDFPAGSMRRASPPPRVFAYDPAENTWREAASPPSGLRPLWPDGGLAWTGSEMAFVSGSWAYGEPWSGVEAVAYDPARDSWRLVAREHENLLFPGTTVVWTGFELVTLDPFGRRVSALDPKTGSWRKLAEAGNRLFGYEAVVADGGDVYVFGEEAVAHLVRTATD